MADPIRKTTEVPYLRRVLPRWTVPAWLGADVWRSFVRRQPIAMDCKGAIISRTMGLPFSVRPKDPYTTVDFLDEIDYYTELLNNIDDESFILWVERVLQDALDLPVGSSSEVVRWEQGHLPFSTPKPEAYQDMGVPYQIYHLDGAGILPTGVAEIPVRQIFPGAPLNAVTLTKEEVLRVYYLPRNEALRRGFGMAPPEVVYLCMVLLNRGDNYYANLLLDTPEAGVLDLIDMSEESAKEWLGSFRSLMFGTDPLKVPVLYEHLTAAKYIPFGRPPSELLYDTTTLRYARVTAGGYGITLRDIGIEPLEQSLAGAIRSDRASYRNGFSTAKAKIASGINTSILPDHLTFIWVDRDDETLIARGRARLANAQAAKAAVGRAVLTAEEWRRQMSEDGIFTTLDLTLSAEDIPSGQTEGPATDRYDDSRESLGSTDPVPASEGGFGEVRAAYSQALFDAATPLRLKRLVRSLAVNGDEPLEDAAGTAWWETSPPFEVIEGIWEEAAGNVALSLGETLYEYGVLNTPQLPDELLEIFDESELSVAQVFADAWGTTLKAELRAFASGLEGETTDEQIASAINECPEWCVSMGEKFLSTAQEWAIREIMERFYDALGISVETSLLDQLDSVVLAA